MPKMKVYRGRVHLFDKRLEEDEVIVGRSADAGIPLDSPAASRRHIRLTLRGWNWYAEHLSNKNPALIEKRPFTTQKLMHGDTITIAEHTLVFEYPRSEQQAAKGVVEGRKGAGYRLHAGDIADALADEDETTGRVDDVRAAAAAANATQAVDPEALAQLIDENEKKRAPHLILASSKGRKEYPLSTEPQVVGWGDGVDIALPGSRWFGRKAARLEVLPRGGHTIEPLSRWVTVLASGKPLDERRGLYDGEVVTLKHALGFGTVKLRYQAAVQLGGKRRR